MKIVYLILSRNGLFWESLDQAARDTYLTDTNNPHYFIKESTVGYSYILDDCIYADVPHGLEWTLYKMKIALECLLEVHPDVDCVVRLNSSTWCNVSATEHYIDTYMPDDEYAGGCALTIPCEYGFFVYLQGQALILRRNEIEEIIKRISRVPEVDDIWMSVFICQMYVRKYGDFRVSLLDEHLYFPYDVPLYFVDGVPNYVSLPANYHLLEKYRMNLRKFFKCYNHVDPNLIQKLNLPSDTSIL